MKGYPKFKAEIIDRSQIQEIDTSIVSGPITVIMQTYTSDKGTEKWEIMRGFDGFSKVKGPISFARHGQPLLTVAEILRAGGVVLAKRLVSEDADLANITVKARLVKIDDASYLYIYTTSMEGAKTFKEAYTDGYGDFDYENPVAEDGTVDVPLFTVAPMGRGGSNLYIRINPEYSSNRTYTNYMNYSFEVYEATEQMESILFTMNPDVIINNVSQAMNPKVKINSTQIQVKLFEDGVSALVMALANTALDVNGDPVAPASLINYDFIYGMDIRGKNKIGGVVTIADAAEDGTDLWSKSMPSDITDNVIDLADPNGIKLINGTFGTMDTNPMKNEAEYEKMLLAAWGADTRSMLFDPVIYDLDMYKVDATFDCAYPLSVKKQILNVTDFRGDMMYFADFGKKFVDLDSILKFAESMPNSRYLSMYHNFFNVYDPYTRREITVTMPYLLAIKMVSHVESGVNRPFAGIANELTFEGIIEDTINFLPYDIPGINQKQMLVDKNVNYLNYYDGIAVMDTMYTNNEEHSQLSYLSNVMGVQEIIKRLRSECPKSRFTFVDGDDLEAYIDGVKEIINEYASQYNTLNVQYMADEKYELNKIFYAVLTVKFREFFQEEYFKIIAIN